MPVLYEGLELISSPLISCLSLSTEVTEPPFKQHSDEASACLKPLSHFKGQGSVQVPFWDFYLLITLSDFNYRPLKVSALTADLYFWNIVYFLCITHKLSARGCLSFSACSSIWTSKSWEILKCLWYRKLGDDSAYKYSLRLFGKYVKVHVFCAPSSIALFYKCAYFYLMTWVPALI